LIICDAEHPLNSSAAIAIGTAARGLIVTLLSRAY
jgi:hypothetical protein